MPLCEIPPLLHGGLVLVRVEAAGAGLEYDVAVVCPRHEACAVPDAAAAVDDERVGREVVGEGVAGRPGEVQFLAGVFLYPLRQLTRLSSSCHVKL